MIRIGDDRELVVVRGHVRCCVPDAFVIHVSLTLSAAPSPTPDLLRGCAARACTVQPAAPPRTAPGPPQCPMSNLAISIRAHTTDHGLTARTLLQMYAEFSLYGIFDFLRSLYTFLCFTVSIRVKRYNYKVKVKDERDRSIEKEILLSTKK